jgi:hypothetical protein
MYFRFELSVELCKRFGSLLQALVRETQVDLVVLPLRDVDHEAHDEFSFGGVERTEAHLDHDLPAVLAHAVEVAPAAHGAGFRVAHVSPAQAGVLFALAHRQENFDHFTVQLVLVVAEHALGCRIDHADLSRHITNNNSLCRIFKQGIKHFQLSLHRAIVLPRQNKYT